MHYKDIIQNIKSVRDYKEDTVSSEIVEQILGYSKKAHKLIGDIGTEVLIKDKEEVYEKVKDIAGYFDVMLEAPHYIIILSEEKEYYLENTGYVGQDIRFKLFELE